MNVTICASFVDTHLLMDGSGANVLQANRIAACDQKLQGHLRVLAAKVDLQAQPLGPRPKGKRARGNAPKFDLRTELYRITGVDWA